MSTLEQQAGTGHTAQLPATPEPRGAPWRGPRAARSHAVFAGAPSSIAAGTARTAAASVSRRGTRSCRQARAAPVQRAGAAPAKLESRRRRVQAHRMASTQKCAAFIGRVHREQGFSAGDADQRQAGQAWSCCDRRSPPQIAQAMAEAPAWMC